MSTCNILYLVLFQTTEEIFDENIEYAPYDEDDDDDEITENNQVYDELVQWKIPSPNDKSITIPDYHTAIIEPTSLDNQSIVAKIIEMYQCTLCKYVTPSVNDFVKHHKVHSEKIQIEIEENDSEEKKQEMFLCGQCSTIFESMELCREHMIKDHKFQEVTEEIEETVDNKEIEDNKEPEVNEVDSNKVTQNFVYCNDEDDDDDDEENRDNEQEDKSFWLKPITLRELKMRLLKKFIHK